MLSLLTTIILSVSAVFAQEAEAKAVITLERTACFGACPMYTLSIFEDGTVVYEGENFVTVEGEQITQIEPETVELMLQAFEDAGYFEWDEAYDSRTISDLPTMITSVTKGDKTHQITRYAGDSSAPLALPYLEQWIDEMTNSYFWTGVEPDISVISYQMNSPIVSIERSPCYGLCPVYSAAFFEDGTVVYIGVANVENMGVHTFTIEPSAIEQVIQIAEISGYFEWADSYDEHLMTDQPTMTTTIMTSKQYKQIARYTGDPNAPIGLKWIEDQIVQLLPS